MPNNSVRYFTEQIERVETGPIRFGDDWPGMFIRGDNALAFAAAITMYLDPGIDQNSRHIFHKVLESLAELLRECRMHK